MGNIHRVSFSDDKIPEFKEVVGRDMILNGDANDYPDRLIELFNRSAKHNAIVVGKSAMIVGDGVEAVTPSIAPFLEQPNPFETFDDINEKITLDLEIFGGFYIQCVWSRDGSKVVEMYHMPFREMRVNKDGTEFYKHIFWKSAPSFSEVAKFPKFDPHTADKRGKAQVFYYKEYRPDLRHYPLPDYFGALQYITIDTEISNFHYNNIRSAFSNSTVITFFNGEPTEEEKRMIVRQLKNQKTGTDNAGGLTVNFALKKDEAPEIVRLQPDEMDKQYLQLYQTVSDEIFIGHRVTNPSIFGVKTAGQLGGRSDLNDSKEIFYADYIKPKVNVLERCYNYLLDFVIKGSKVVIKKGESEETEVVETPTAKAFSAQNENDVLALFDTFGEAESGYRIIKQRRLRFAEQVEEEEKWIESFVSDYNFAEVLDVEITDRQRAILSVIKENPKLNIAEISNITKIPVATVDELVQDLVNNKVLKFNPKAGTIELTDSGLKTIDEENLITTEIFVKYKYTGPEDDKNRAFCAQVLQKARLYTREDIDKVTDLAGYNVWTQRGGWYHNPKTDVNTPYCRHFWTQVIVKRKTK